MTRTRWKAAMGLLMIANGLFFAANVVAFRHPELGVGVFHDPTPLPDQVGAALKVVVTILAGLAFLVAGLGLVRAQRSLLPAGFVGFVLFDGFLLGEIWRGARPVSVLWSWPGLFFVLAFGYWMACRRAWKEDEAL